MQNCKTCGNAVYDEQWGCYKCSVYQQRIKNPNRYLDCEDYETKNWVKSKKEKEKKNED